MRALIFWRQSSMLKLAGGLVLQSFQLISALLVALRLSVCLTKVLQGLPAFFLQSFAQFCALQAALEQGLYGNRAGGVHCGTQVVGLRVSALFQA
jgi:hypothetical protein